jgi:hypothetical protein
MPVTEGLLRICCLARSENLEQYAGLQSVAWDLTTRARVVAAGYGSEEALRESQRADRVYLDCSSEGLAGALATKDMIPKVRRALVCYSEDRRAWMKGESQISRPKLEQNLIEWLNKEVASRNYRPPKIEPMASDRDLELLLPSIEWCLGPVLELYFPDQPGPAYVHSVGGGLSGTPLVRIEFKGSHEQYYLKFFGQDKDFQAEWNQHKSACRWLDPFAVKLKPVPDVPEDAACQCVPLRGLNDRLPPPDPAARPRFHPAYPVCYLAARDSKTLKAHYQAAPAGSTFPQAAYSQVVCLLRIRSSPSWRDPSMLDECEDFGPASPTNPRQTILKTLRSAKYRAFIDRACLDLDRLKTACGDKVSWADGIRLLNGLLTDVSPAGIAKQYSLCFGDIHGDANSRNLLFGNGAAGTPCGRLVCDLQVIDCGSHASDAPLLFDPPQLESDLKINLMATEEASGYEEIDAAQLPKWIEMEKLSIEKPFAFDIPEDQPESVKRAYGIVKLIRGRVQEISPKDEKGEPDPHPYFYFLLYWTLRKLSVPAVPPTKRLFAMASVFLLLEHLK